MPPTNHHFTLFTRSQYHKELLRRISETKRGDRVFLATMSLHPQNETIGGILDALCQAAARGVTVNLMVDAFIFMVKNGVIPGPMLFKRGLSERQLGIFKKRLAALEKLRTHGGNYIITNQPKRPMSNPFSGRSHIKFSVVNDYVFIGGCNLAEADYLDLMAGWQDEKIAGWLRGLSRRVQAAGGSVLTAQNSKDIQLAVDNTTTLLVDAGQPNQSLILDTVMALIDSAQKYITLTCQFFPNDITARHLAQAVARGVAVEVIYNHPSRHPLPLNLLHHGVVLSERMKKPPELFTRQLPKNHPYIHAKLLATDQGTLLGSHNYVRAGVAFGTAEIALFSRSRGFTDSALAALKSQLA